MSEYRIAKEGRAKWVVRKRHPGTDVWKPVWYAASWAQASEYVSRQTDRQETVA